MILVTVGDPASQPLPPAARKLSVRLADCTAVPTMAVLYTSVRRCRVREYRTGTAGGTSLPCSGQSIGGVGGGGGTGVMCHLYTWRGQGRTGQHCVHVILSDG